MIKAPREFTKEVRKEMKQSMEDVAARANMFHRFTTRSGNLERSVKTKVSNSGFTGTIRLEPGIASYGKYIHEGFKRWKPDQFLYSSFEKLKPEIIKNLQDGIMRGFRKVGLA